MSDTFAKDGSLTKLTLNTGTGGSASGADAPPTVAAPLQGSSGAQSVSVPGASVNEAPKENKDPKVRRKVIEEDFGFGSKRRIELLIKEH